MSLKMVAVDIDGTLLNSDGELPLDNLQAIRRAIEKGIDVVLVTGRRYGTAKRVADILELDSPLVSHNGALIKSSPDAQRMAAWFLAPQIASEILAATEPFLSYMVLHKDTPSRYQMVTHPLCESNLPLQTYLDKLPHAVCQEESLQNAVDEDLIQIMFSGAMPAMVEVERHLRENGFLEKVKLSKTYYPEKNLGIIDVLDKHCSKQRALRFLAESFGYQPKEILAIGDNHNDLEMLEYAGVAVIVANCVEELKGRGFEETLSNNDSGVARTLEKFLFCL
jgi:Cof subfamily protein (haloacid dehalogenase superfamily)